MSTEKTKSELNEQYELLRQKAKEKGMPLFLGTLHHSRPTAEWKGGWSSFLDAASQIEARVLYLEKVRFDAQDDESRVYSNEIEIYQVQEQIESQKQRLMGRSFARSSYEMPDEETLAPILSKLASWKKHKNEIVELRCVWFKEGIAHEWQSQAKWLEDWKTAVREAAREAQENADLNKILRTQEDALRLHTQAQEMGRHQRYPDAKSDEKRSFMALQIFPNEDENIRNQIINLASLHYWWSIEPEQAANNDERARQLHQRGEAMTNIAAILDMPIAKVKRAIQSAPSAE